MKSLTKNNLWSIVTQISTLVVTVFAMIVVTSCTKEQMIDNPNEIITSGPVKVSLHIDVPEMEKVETRATAEETILVLSVMTFNSAGELTDAPQEVIMLGSGAAIKYYAILQATSQSRTVYVIVNSAAAISAYGATYGWNVLGVAGVTSATATKLSDVKANLKMPDLATTTTNITVQPSLLPMVGEKLLPSGITSATIISNDGTTTNPLPLVRAAAKITVVVNPSVTVLGNMGATLIKAPNNGRVLSSTPLLTSGVTLKNYSGHATALTMMTRSNDPTQTKPLYCYESAKENGTAVVIDTENGFYRLDLIDKVTRMPIDINRNTSYTITINKVDNEGYDTAVEAAANPPSNIEYEIDVTDLNSHNIVTNGQYFLGVSNSDLIIYGSSAQANVVAVTITYNAPATVTTAEIYLSSPGNDIYMSSSSTGLAVSGSFATLAAPNGSRQTAVLKLNLSPFTTLSTTSQIEIQVGNLRKTITITRMPILSPVGVVMQDFKGSTNVKGEIESSEAVGWLKLSAFADGTGATTSTIISPSGGIYPVLSDNLPVSGGLSRWGAFYISHSGDSGRTRVIVSQEVFNTATPNPVPLPYPYVGAFWRANQTGERLIRMPVSGPSNMYAWTATVMDGADWVVLDTNPTTDPGVNWNSTSATPADMNSSDASYKVAGNLRYVRGFASTATDYIYFRIGLRGTYTPTPSAPARYARVAVTYGQNSQMHIMYIRQGEGADYLMRPNDTDGAGTTVADSRNFARKFSPYNLTATTLDAPATIHGSADGNAGKFAAYPTQTGAMWQWANPAVGKERMAYNAYTQAASGWSNSYLSTYWDALRDVHESCPSGYRRPTDGTTTVANAAGLMVSSEIRQSLWLYPPTLYQTETRNSITGYYADGFFDRRMIVNGPGVNPNDKSSVYIGYSSVAHTGRLFYNPNNNASIFFAQAGYRDSSGALNNVGRNGDYWSASAPAGTTALNLHLINSPLSSGMSNSIRTNAVPIRCVVDNTMQIRSYGSLGDSFSGPGLAAEKDMFVTNVAANFGPVGAYKAIDGVNYVVATPAPIYYSQIKDFDGVLIIPFGSYFLGVDSDIDLIAERIKSGKLAIIMQSDGLDPSFIYRSDVRIMANLLGKSSVDYSKIFEANQVPPNSPRPTSFAYTAKSNAHPYLTAGHFAIPTGFTSIGINPGGSPEWPINMAAGVAESDYNDFVVLGRKTATSSGDVMMAAHRRYPFLIVRNGAALEAYSTSSITQKQGLNSLWLNFVTWASEYKKSVAAQNN